MKYKSILIFATIVLVTLSCSNNKKRTSNNTLPPLKIEIPKELKDNKEAVQFIKISEITINEWSNTLEELFQKTEEYANVPEENLSMMDKMKLAKIGMEFVGKMAEFGSKITEIESTASAIENGLSEEELLAFEVAQKAFKNRIEELGKKYENYGKSK